MHFQKWNILDKFAFTVRGTVFCAKTAYKKVKHELKCEQVAMLETAIEWAELAIKNKQTHLLPKDWEKGYTDCKEMLEDYRKFDKYTASLFVKSLSLN